jgi:probable HAF family extracellular repeat protein
MKSLTLLSAGMCLAAIVVPSALASSAYTCTTFIHGSAAYTLASGINNNGQVVGVSYTDSPPGQPAILHAFLRNADGTITTLTSPGGSDDFEPVGINNHGQILGQGPGAFIPNSGAGAFILNPDGSHTDIAPAVAPPGQAYLSTTFSGINDKGVLAGTIDSEPNPSQPAPDHVELAFIRGADGVYRIIDQIVPSLPFPLFSGPINNSNFVVEHTRDAEGFLLQPNGPKIPLLFPGLDAQFLSRGFTATGLNNNNVTASSFSYLFPENSFAFLRASDGHYPAIVCPDVLNKNLSITGVNDRNAVVGTISSNSPGLGAQTVGFIATPTGVFPHAQLSQTSWTFGSHVTGETSGLGRVFVSNTGPADLHIPALYVGVTGQTVDPRQTFQVTQTDCGKWIPPGFVVEPGTIPPGASCFLEFTFTPQVRGWQTADIYIVDDSRQSPEIVEVGGTGIGGSLRLSTTSWSFAAHRVGETSGDGVIYAYNPGPGKVTFNNTQIVEAAQPSNFKLLRNTCGSALQPYTTCSVTFNFAPSAAGDQTATLNLNDDALNGPIQIPLSGYGY